MCLYEIDLPAIRRPIDQARLAVVGLGELFCIASAGGNDRDSAIAGPARRIFANQIGDLFAVRRIMRIRFRRGRRGQGFHFAAGDVDTQQIGGGPVIRFRHFRARESDRSAIGRPVKVAFDVVVARSQFLWLAFAVGVFLQTHQIQTIHLHVLVNPA